MTDDTDLPPGSFDKEDGGDDLAFYAPPRLVTHIDEIAVEALTGFYRDLLRRMVASSISCRAGSATCPIIAATARWSATA